jgi:hypothetical protein
MNVTFHPRSIAAAIFRGALRIAPPQVAEWGRAMYAELHHVEGDWAALAWALGSAGVLAKHALVALFIPTANQGVTSSENLFAKEKPMRKATLIGAAVCLFASLLFFAAPTFRQAFQIALVQWHSIVSSLYGGRYYEAEAAVNYSAIIEKARASHDAEDLAFVAVHRWGAPGAAAEADEAVRMDPSLTWIYAVIASRNWTAPELDTWIAKLEQFDPQNALPHLIAAEDAESRSVLSGKYRVGDYKNDPAWRSAVAAAFASTKLDTYADRMQQLDYDVSRRYGFSDPFQAESEYFLSLGIAPGVGNSVDYANSMVSTGDALEARGDYAGAAKQYWLVVHFGEMLHPPQRRSLNAYNTGIFAAMFLETPYRRLAALYAKQGDQNQAQLFTYLADATEDAHKNTLSAIRQSLAGSPADRWNAAIVGVSGIALFLCAAVLVVCLVVAFAKSRSPGQASRGAFHRFLAATSAIGVLFSSLALYLSYRPYDELVRAYLRDGDPAHLQPLTVFLGYLDYDSYPPRAGTLYNLHHLPVYFWTATITLCAAALIFAAVKFVASHRPAAA